VRNRTVRWLVYSLLHLSSSTPCGLDALLLAGSLPCGVRTFLSSAITAKQRPPVRLPFSATSQL